jgi:centrosomal protein CEP41
LQKNQEGKLIIIYHLDEKHGMPAATFFSEKGFENVFLLNGGVESFL